MKILDTNCWVFGTLGTNERAAELVESIDRGETESAISAYIVIEALSAFDRTPGLTPAERDEVKTLFLTRLTRMTGLVEAPSSRDTAGVALEDRRSSAQVRLIARVLGIQPKDVPIVVLAFTHADRAPTIVTNDASFAELTPAAHDLPEITIEHVP